MTEAAEWWRKSAETYPTRSRRSGSGWFWCAIGSVCQRCPKRSSQRWRSARASLERLGQQVQHEDQAAVRLGYGRVEGRGRAGSAMAASAGRPATWSVAPRLIQVPGASGWRASACW